MLLAWVTHSVHLRVRLLQPRPRILSWESVCALLNLHSFLTHPRVVPTHKRTFIFQSDAGMFCWKRWTRTHFLSTRQGAVQQRWPPRARWPTQLLQGGKRGPQIREGFSSHGGRACPDHPRQTAKLSCACCYPAVNRVGTGHSLRLPGGETIHPCSGRVFSLTKARNGKAFLSKAAAQSVKVECVLWSPWGGRKRVCRGARSYPGSRGGTV